MSCCRGFQGTGGEGGANLQHDRFVYDQDVDGDGSTSVITTTVNSVAYGQRALSSNDKFNGWGWIPDTWDLSDPEWILVIGEDAVGSLDTHTFSLATRAVADGTTVDLAFTNDSAFAGFTLGGLAFEWEKETQVKGFPVGDSASPGDFYLWEVERTDSESGSPAFIMLYVIWSLT